MTKTTINPPAMTFGSKEWNEYYGLRHGSRATGDKAQRARKGLKASLTRKGEAAHLDAQRQTLETDGRRLAKEQTAEDRAEARILGPKSRTHALKIAKPSGTFGPEDVQAFLASGWQVHPAGSVSAKTGLSLGALVPWDLALNPSPDLGRLLGPQQAARALVLAATEAVITSDTLHEFRRAGYDVAPAPKALREGRRTATNPPGPEKRVYAVLVKAAKHGDAPTLEDLVEALQEPEDTIRGHLGNLARRGLAHPVQGGLFGSGWAPGSVQPMLAFNPPKNDKPGRQIAPGADTRPTRGAEPESMTNSKPSAKKRTAKSGRKATPKPAAKPPAKKAAGKPRPEPSKVQPLQSPKAARFRAEKAVEAILDQAAKGQAKAKPAAKKAAAPKGTLESATLKIRFNPGSVADVQRVWKAWTGAQPGQVLKLTVEDPTGSLPADVALLGRVSRLIQPDGGLKDFGESGPLLVTDGKAKHVWMVHPKGFRFDLHPSVICYLAKKPKFGDRELIEYVHAFDRPARARMQGQVGTLTGGFKLTPRGIEG